ncbi:MAG: hypothetical protein KatS3mg009_2664 [Acidimicrobiia bacterium]|nr:MAG: hypothetical protein KatS3mg009_2664 [Acidimicrobiia bacterium]
MSPTRRELVRATRTRIVDAAARLMRERGASGWSMDVLAKEAGVARATVYEHFRSKRAVLDELAATAAREIVLEPPAATEDPLRALRDVLAEVCRHWAAHGETMRDLRTLKAMTGAPTTSDAIGREDLAHLVESLAATGQLRQHWTTEDAVDALGVLTSYATFERLRAPGRSPEEIEAVLARLAVAVVAPSASTSPNPGAPAGTG